MPGGADAENQIVTLDGVEVAALVHGLRRNDFLAEAALFSAFHQTAQTRIGVRGHHAQEAVEIAVIEHVPGVHQRYIIVQDTGGAGDSRVVAFNLQRVIEQPRADLKAGFDQADIFVAGPEQGLNATADLYAGFHSREVQERNTKPDIRGRGGRVNICLQHSRKTG